MHLRMTGNLLLAERGRRDAAASAGTGSTRRRPSRAHLRAELELDDGRLLRFTDPRRFGHASLLRPESSTRTSAPGSASSRSTER